MTRDPYIERWCQITKMSLRIFAGNEAIAPSSSQLLNEIPIARIAYVRRVKYDIAARSSTLSGVSENQFEIILKD